LTSAATGNDPPAPALGPRARRAASAIITGAVLLLALHAAHGGEIEYAEVRYADGRYAVEAQLHLEAPAEHVYAVMTDHDRLHRASKAFRRSELLERYDAHNARRRLEVHTCLLVFCFDFGMTEHVEELGDGTMVTTIIPELSDFHGGEARYRIEPRTARTSTLRFSLWREPRFWVPPIIGPWIIKQKLRSELIESILRTETLAREHDAAQD